MINQKSKTALVTGATGFIGYNLVKRLLKDGWDIHIITRPGSNLAILSDIAEKITIHEHSGTTGNMFSIIEASKPDIVFHLSSLFLAQHTPKDIEPMIISNITFGTQLAEAMIANNVYSLINTGTSWQHFENANYNPVCLYAATKQAFENILIYYTQTTPLHIINLKLFDTYGKNDPRPKLFTLLEKVAREQQPLAMSPGEQLIDIVYIDDVIEAFIVAAQRLINKKATQWEEYAISSGKPIKLKELVATYSNIIGKNLPIEWGGRPYRTREVMTPWNTGKKLDNWHPKISLEEGIKKLYQNNNYKHI